MTAPAVWVTGAGGANERLLGGKAFNLARLAEMGERVPPFFVVTTAAMRETLERSEPLRAAAEARRFDELRNRLHTASMSPELSTAILETYARVLPAGGMVAVRSSAVGEDALGESFAGIHESFLFVRREGLLEAIAGVWASAYSERALSYRESRRLDVVDVQIAVVVQRMVDAAVSGVAFTADPASGDVHRVVVSSLFGLGEGLVSGGLDADLFTMDKRSLAIERNVVEKSERVDLDVSRGEGVARGPVQPELRNSPTLDDEQLRAVAEAALRIERTYGTPQDIEFAIDHAGTLWILQSRPITTVDEDGPAAGNGLLWDNSNIIESFSGVTSPMTFSVIRRAYAVVYRCFSEVMGIAPETIRRHQSLYENMLGLIRGRVYYNLRSWYLLLRLFPGFEYNREFMESMMGVKESYAPEAASRAGASFARRYLVELPALARLVARSAWNFVRIRSLVSAFERYFEEHFERWAALDMSRLKPHELMALYRDIEDEILLEWRPPIINDLYVMVFYGLLKKLSTAWAGDTTGSLQNDLICGEGGIRSTEPTFRLMEIARAVRAQPDLSHVFAALPAGEIAAAVARDERFADFRRDFRSYLDEYGMRCMNELKLEEPTLRDRPDFAYQVLRNYVTGNAMIDPESLVAREREIRARAEERAYSVVRTPWRRAIFRVVLRNARTGVKNRENMRFARTRIFGLVREIIRALGAHLLAAGVIERADDVFYLTLDEVFDFVKGTAVTTRLRELVELRRAEFDEYRGDDANAPDDRFETFGMVYHRNRFRSRAVALPGAAPAADGSLRGIPCSPGRVTNKVKVILTPSDDAHLSGEILVAGRTDPGWVPLYPSVSGLLIERGSILSHSAIVAREMGIPTIVGIPGLIAAVRTGQTVTMDGSTGSVEIVETAS